MNYQTGLEHKHACLDRRIAELSRAPSANLTEIGSLKKQKLALKDKIAGLRRDSPPTQERRTA